MRIHIKKLTGKTFALDNVEPDQTVHDIKERIHQITEIGPGQQRLVYGGQVLDDWDTLEAYEIEDGSVIDFFLRLSFR
jgi:hypothetical protein